jgi:hypothetical protein
VRHDPGIPGCFAFAARQWSGPQNRDRKGAGGKALRMTTRSLTLAVLNCFPCGNLDGYSCHDVETNQKWLTPILLYHPAVPWLPKV